MQTKTNNISSDYFPFRMEMTGRYDSFSHSDCKSESARVRVSEVADKEKDYTKYKGSDVGQ